MYNDFHNNANCSCCFNVYAPAYFDINYSGETECMFCGSALDSNSGDGGCEGECCDIDDAGCLCCNSCMEVQKCDNCGCRCYDSYYEVDDMILCDDCYSDNVGDDYFTDEPHLYDNMYKILLVKDPEDLKNHEARDYVSIYVYKNHVSAYMKCFHYGEVIYHCWSYDTTRDINYITFDDLTEQGKKFFGDDKLFL
jgi:hypothetical protein